MNVIPESADRVRPSSAPPVAPTVIVGLLCGWSFVTTTSWHLSHAIVYGMPWTTGDWLINYEGGFVRRGLAGTLILELTPPGHAAVAVTGAVLLLLITTVFSAAVGLFWGTSRSASWAMVLVSPAFLLFPGLDLQHSARKEIVALAACAVLALVVRYRLPSWWLVPSVLVFVVGAFSHETVAMSLPAVLALLWLGVRNGTLSRTWAVTSGAVVSVAALAALILSALYPGGAAERDAICRAITEHALPEALCGGSVATLGGSVQDALLGVAGLYPAHLVYVPLALVALLPFVAVGATRVFWWLVAAVYVGLVPLFATAMDYNRWIVLATGCISFIALAGWQVLGFRERRTPVLLLLAYAMLWSVPLLPRTVHPLIARLVEQGVAVVGSMAPGA